MGKKTSEQRIYMYHPSRLRELIEGRICVARTRAQDAEREARKAWRTYMSEDTSSGHAMRAFRRNQVLMQRGADYRDAMSRLHDAYTRLPRD